MRRSLSRPALLAMLSFSLSPCFASSAGKPSVAGSLRIGIVGDQFGVNNNADPYPVLERGLALLKQQNVQLILHAGDLIEGIGQNPAEYKNRFDHAAQILDQVQIPWYLTPGDHDVNPKDYVPNSVDRSIEKLFFDNYHPRRPELGQKLFYSFDIGAYHFVALNSLEHLRTDVRWGDAFLAGITDEQFAWLQEDLAKHRSAAGIVVFTHQPLWCNVGAWQPVHRLLRQYPVRAVVAGHLHYSQDEGELDGIRYLVVGATGAMVKEGGPEAGGVQVVAVITLSRSSTIAELFPIDSRSALKFASRRDMDRVQALDYVMDSLRSWTYQPENSFCLKNGALIMPNKNNSPAVVRLRSIGNPLDIPANLEIIVDVEGATTHGRFASSICSRLSGQDCVLAPATNVDLANISTVEFRWPDMTEAACSQEVLPLPAVWEAAIADMGANLKPGATLHLRLKYSFDGEGGVKHLERDIQTVVSACADQPSRTSTNARHHVFRRTRNHEGKRKTITALGITAPFCCP